MTVSLSGFKGLSHIAIATLLCTLSLQIRVFSQPLNTSSKADSQLQLCEQTLQQKQVDAAIKACLNAQRLYQTLEEPTPLQHRQGEIKATILLGQAYEKARQIESAITEFKKGLTLAEKFGQYQPKIVAGGSLALLYESIGKTVEAQRYRAELARSP